MSVDPGRFALIGRTGAGKSEVAQILGELRGCQIVKTGRICRQVSKLLFGNEDKRSTQLLDDVLTPIDASIFLKAALRDINIDLPTVIDSLRFTSDFKLAGEMGFRIIRVAAPEHQRNLRLTERGQVFDPTRNGNHRSEIELDHVPVLFTLVNDGSREELRERLTKAIEPFRR